MVKQACLVCKVKWVAVSWEVVLKTLEHHAYTKEIVIIPGSLTLYASPQRTGLPTKTALAPMASAFSTSVPCLTPPSMNTSTLPPTACTTSGRTSICGNGRNSTDLQIMHTLDLTQPHSLLLVLHPAVFHRGWTQ